MLLNKWLYFLFLFIKKPGGFVFLNNGGSVDLVSFLLDGIEDLNGIVFYVLDSNRPFDLDNVSDENQTVFF